MAQKPPKQHNPTKVGRTAKAPYNFIPLPNKMVTACPPLDQDTYAEGLTGWITCDLETCSPTYIRGMMTEAQFQQYGQTKSDELTPEQKKERAPFFATTQEEIAGYFRPVIPGSSLRGMIRTLVEIISFGRMRWVAPEPTFAFRAVAAPSNDPLRDPYRKVLGGVSGRNVQAGYLKKKGDDWFVRPAISPKALNLPEKGSYLKVKEHSIEGKAIPGYIRLNSSDYRPQAHKVSFDVESRSGKRGSYVAVTRIGTPAKEYSHQGTLVCSGNMLETRKPDQKSSQESPRKNHALILAVDENAKEIKTDPQAIKDYLASLSPFQKEKLKDWGDSNGCLKDGAPVFYVLEDGKVMYFGHSPNFRLPARLAGQKRAATPLDFVPKHLINNPQPDFADAIFGWVEEQGLKGQRAGRVFFTDAYLTKATDGIWLKPQPITPHILASPKPTAFQHYLVQDSTKGHNPNQRKNLAHYGTSPKETQIRGYKQYWHKGTTPDIEATTKEQESESQLTRIVPLKPNVRFQFKIYFDRLRPEELGALWWALSLPGLEGQTYRHKLGMGKPLGMGAVALNPTLYLTQRKKRYQHLFEGTDEKSENPSTWYEAEQKVSGDVYARTFERFVLDQVAPSGEHLIQLERIHILLTMLQWRESEGNWLEKTRSMGIEYGLGEDNEYKNRPVLPDPFVVSEEQFTETKVAPIIPKGYQQGTVKNFGLGPKQSYGFIQPDDQGSDVFVHISQLHGDLQTLEENQRVIFKVVRGTKGPQAEDVRLIID